MNSVTCIPPSRDTSQQTGWSVTTRIVIIKLASARRYSDRACLLVHLFVGSFVRCSASVPDFADNFLEVAEVKVKVQGQSLSTEYLPVVIANWQWFKFSCPTNVQLDRCWTTKSNFGMKI